MFIVTGGAGFIGSNLVKALNQRGHKEILVVDDLSDGTKFANLADLDIADYADKDEFIAQVLAGENFGHIDAIFHLGACSATTEWDGKFMMENNYDYSKELLHYALERGIPFQYASSASVYGAGPIFVEDRANEKPLNVYGYSKFLFDEYVRKILPEAQSQVAGFRYFNVYGPRETHKQSMASVAFHLNNQVLAGENPKLFEGCDGYENGGQLRDFVYVEDVCQVHGYFLDNPEQSGIFNLGTGKAEPFKAVAQAVVDFHGQGEIEFIPFPEHLKGRYQSYTQADISALRRVGYDKPFKTVAEGVTDYLTWLNQK